MKAESVVARRAAHDARAFLGRTALLEAAALLVLAPAAHAVEPATPGSVAKSAAVKLETIPGSTAKRVILTAKAAERLGIETSKVGEEPIVRRQMAGGLVTVPYAPQAIAKPASTGFASFAMGAAVTAARQPAAVPAIAAAQPGANAATAPPIDGEAWVLVTLSRGEWEKLAKDKPARVLPLVTHEKPANEIRAQPSGMPPIEDTKRSMLTLYYVVPGKDHGLMLHKRVRVELQQSGSEEKHKVVPYSAVYYDATGSTWVYVNTEPFVFERRRIGVERVMGDLAVLSDGPPIGTAVVVVGAPLLYGAEIFGK
jgi:hypothetical protein